MESETFFLPGFILEDDDTASSFDPPQSESESLPFDSAGRPLQDDVSLQHPSLTTTITITTNTNPYTTENPWSDSHSHHKDQYVDDVLSQQLAQLHPVPSVGTPASFWNQAAPHSRHQRTIAPPPPPGFEGSMAPSRHLETTQWGSLSALQQDTPTRPTEPTRTTEEADESNPPPEPKATTLTDTTDATITTISTTTTMTTTTNLATEPTPRSWVRVVADEPTGGVAPTHATPRRLSPAQRNQQTPPHDTTHTTRRRTGQTTPVTASATTPVRRHTQRRPPIPLTPPSEWQRRPQRTATARADGTEPATTQPTLTTQSPLGSPPGNTVKRTTAARGLRETEEEEEEDSQSTRSSQSTHSSQRSHSSSSHNSSLNKASHASDVPSPVPQWLVEPQAKATTPVHSMPTTGPGLDSWGSAWETLGHAVLPVLAPLGGIFASLAKTIIILALLLAQVFQYAAAEVEQSESSTFLGYLILYVMPNVCDGLMSLLTLPHYTPHVLSSLALYWLCEPVAGLAGTSSTGRRRGSRPTRGDPTADRLGRCLLQACRYSIPVHLLLEGFSQPNTRVMMLDVPCRLMLAYALSVVRAGLLLSPVAWVCGSVQVLLSVHMPFHKLTECLLLLLGLASVRASSVVARAAECMPVKEM